MTDEKPKKRYWVVRHSFLMVHDMPADWGKRDVDFFYNESSHCSSNEAVDIGMIAGVGNHVCGTCGSHEAKALQAFDTQEEAHEANFDGQRALDSSPRARLESLLKDEILSPEEHAEELKRLEAIEKLW